jgi:hypothetical protein
MTIIEKKDKINFKEIKYNIKVAIFFIIEIIASKINLKTIR